MLNKTSKEFRSVFLLKFTEELIRNCSDIEIIRLEELLTRKGELDGIKKTDIKRDVKIKLNERSLAPKSELKVDPFSKPDKVRKKMPLRRLSIPTKRMLGIGDQKPFLPPTVANIKPVANSKVLIDLGKLMPLVNDPNVKMIEVEGGDQKVVVEGSMGRKPTSISLTTDEINSIIDNFSKEAKIPKTDGMFKVAVGTLVLTAMISESISSRFIIRKLEENNPPMGPVH